MNVIEKIDQIRVNSVTDEEFKRVWGNSIDEHIAEIMEFVRKYDAKHSIKR